MKTGFEEGDKCNRNGCEGVMGYYPVEGCSCHINPPCSQCVNNPCVCMSCGEAVEVELTGGGGASGTTPHDVPTWEPRKLDNSKIDYHTKSHTHFSQICEGVYPAGTKKSEVLEKVKGTFGGRFESFGNGRFKYIAYTD